MIYSRSQLQGILYDENLLPGTMGFGDIGWPSHCEFTIGIEQSRVRIGYGDNDVFTPEIWIQPFLGKAASIGWRFSADPWEIPEPQTEYSFTWEQYYPYGNYVGPDANYAKQILQVMDEATRRWGIQISSYTPPSIFDPYYEALSNVVSLVDGDGTVLAGGTYALGSISRYRFECEVKESSPTVTVRIYKYISGTATLVHTMTSDPDNTAAREWRIGNFDGDPAIQNSEYNVFFPQGWPATMNTVIRNVASWSTYNADGEFPNYNMPNPSGISWSVYNAETNAETPISAPKMLDASVETDVLDIWDNPLRFRGRPETKYSVPIDEEGISYGEDILERYTVYTPNGTPPEDGWPVVAFVMVGYYSVGLWSDMYDQYYTTLTQILNMGCAAVPVGVRVGELVSSWLFGAFRPAVFPTAIIDAKRCIRHLIDNAESYNINPNKIYTGGHSSGGSLGLCAMITRDMTDNGHGTDLTIAGNGFSEIVDPPIAGSIVLDAPTNFRKTWDEDPCYPHASLPYQLYGVDGGNVRAAINMYNGGTPVDSSIDTTQIEIADWVAVAPELRPVLYIASNGDTVVPAHNGTNLQTAYEAREGAPEVTYFDMGGVKHDFMTAIPCIETMKQWLKVQGAL